MRAALGARAAGPSRARPAAGCHRYMRAPAPGGVLESPLPRGEMRCQDRRHDRPRAAAGNRPADGHHRATPPTDRPPRRDAADLRVLVAGRPVRGLAQAGVHSRRQPPLAGLISCQDPEQPSRTLTLPRSTAQSSQYPPSPRGIRRPAAMLRFADSAAIMELIRAPRAQDAGRGGTLELTSLQPAVARILSMLGVDQVLAVRARPKPPGHDPAADDRRITGARQVGCLGRPRVVGPGSCRMAGRGA
jgi:hypothetical protein